jgi:hypothetical protein
VITEYKSRWSFRQMDFYSVGTEDIGLNRPGYRGGQLV